MSPAEHAIENAVHAMEHNQSFKDWSDRDINLQYINATADEIWSMAQWMLYVKCYCCEKKKDDVDWGDGNVD